MKLSIAATLILFSNVTSKSDEEGCDLTKCVMKCAKKNKICVVDVAAPLKKCLRKCIRKCPPSATTSAPPTTSPTALTSQFGNDSDLPPTTTGEFVHAICVKGASNPYAIGKGSDGSTQVTYQSMNYYSGIKAWSDRNYRMYNTGGSSPCDGGLYLKPSRVEAIARGTVINIQLPNLNQVATVCVFVERANGRDGGYPNSIPALGFTYVGDKVSWGTTLQRFPMQMYCIDVSP